MSKVPNDFQTSHQRKIQKVTLEIDERIDMFPCFRKILRVVSENNDKVFNFLYLRKRWVLI